MKYLVLTILLMSCAQTTFKEVIIDEQDYGNFPQNYKENIQAYWDKTLKDPSSLQVKNMTKPTKGYILRGTEKPHWYDDYSDVTFNPDHGYYVCIIYNAKNSYGAYIGHKKKAFFFKNGKMSIPIMTDKELLKGMHRKRSMKGIEYIVEGCRK
jgi:hypothetical protein